MAEGKLTIKIPVETTASEKMRHYGFQSNLSKSVSRDSLRSF